MALHLSLISAATIVGKDAYSSTVQHPWVTLPRPLGVLRGAQWSPTALSIPVSVAYEHPPTRRWTWSLEHGIPSWCSTLQEALTHSSKTADIIFYRTLYDRIKLTCENSREMYFTSVHTVQQYICLKTE